MATKPTDETVVDETQETEQTQETFVDPFEYIEVDGIVRQFLRKK